MNGNPQHRDGFLKRFTRVVIKIFLVACLATAWVPIRLHLNGKEINTKNATDLLQDTVETVKNKVPGLAKEDDLLTKARKGKLTQAEIGWIVAGVIGFIAVVWILWYHHISVHLRINRILRDMKARHAQKGASARTGQEHRNHIIMIKALRWRPMVNLTRGRASVRGEDSKKFLMLRPRTSFEVKRLLDAFETDLPGIGGKLKKVSTNASRHDRKEENPYTTERVNLL